MSTSSFGRRLSKAEKTLTPSPGGLEAKMKRGVDRLVSFACEHGIKVDRERAESLLEMVAAERTENGAFDFCQMLIEGGAPPEQAAARVQEAERLWAA
jgi:hypothetical protein